MKWCEEANVSMCMCFVDFHPSVLCTSKGLFHILFMLYTLRKPSYPFGPRTTCPTVGRNSPKMSEVALHPHYKYAPNFTQNLTTK